MINFIFFNDFRNKSESILFEKKASLPPFRIAQLLDLRHSAATSAVTLGLLSYIIPITPIGVVTRFILSLFFSFPLFQSFTYWILKFFNFVNRFNNTLNFFFVQN